MDHANLDPIKELKILDEDVERANELGALRPIFYRAGEIARQHADNFSVQLAADDLKQHLKRRGDMLQKREPATPESRATVFPPVPPPSSGTETPTVDIPIPPGPPDASAAAPGSQTSGVPDRPDSTPKPASFVKSKRGLWVAAASCVVIAVAAALLVNVALKRPFGTAAADVPLQIGTVPPGASVRVNGEVKCTSNCKLSLPPGKYEISAVLDGYEPAASVVTLAAGQPPSSLNLAMAPQPQTVRIITDLARGKIEFDGQSRADLQLGQYLIERVPHGLHHVKVTGLNGEASFSFELAPAKLPSITGTVVTRNVLAVLVTSFGTQAHVVTSSGPWQLAVNGEPENEAGPAGVDLKKYHPGVDELILAYRNERQSFKQNFGPAPTLTAFLKTDVNAGTLIVATGENDTRVFVNSREYLSKRGLLRIQTIGPVSVRVAKSGFEDAPAQTVEVKKGAETRLQFKMKPLKTDILPAPRANYP